MRAYPVVIALVGVLALVALLALFPHDPPRPDEGSIVQVLNVPAHSHADDRH